MTTALLARLFPGSRSAPRLRCEHPALYCPRRGGARSEHAVRVARRGGRRYCYIRPLRRCQIHGCTARPFRRQQGARAPRCTVALTCAARVLALFLSRNEERPRRARRSSQTTRAAPTPPQTSCRCLGGHVRNRCSLFTLPHSHAIPGAACDRVCTVLAQDWHSARRPFAPRELRMHPGWVLPRTDGNQHAVSTTCRTGGVQFAFQMNNADACRVAPRLRQ